MIEFNKIKILISKLIMMIKNKKKKKYAKIINNNNCNNKWPCQINNIVVINQNK